MAKYRLPDGRQQQKRIGPAWTQRSAPPRLLHRAAIVVVDLTGVRPNCTMELGYALGRHRRILISAIKGTRLPFDPDKLPTFIWDPEAERDEKAEAYSGWFDRHSEPPPIVS